MSRGASVRRAWQRAKVRAAYGMLRAVGFAARRFPNMKVPSWVPLAGDIDGKVWAPPVKVQGFSYGPSMTIPSILEIHVDGTTGETRPSALAPVAQRIFKDYPPFVFNVSFACGAAKPRRPGVYGDPRSPWFNVFVGYYEIDVAKRVWGRPFGYQPRSAGGYELALDDISRLGEADWNYFSNFMYGVPLSAIGDLDQPEAELKIVDPVMIAGRRWDCVEGSGMDVVSAFISDGTDQLLNNHRILSEIWRCAFGQGSRSAGFGTSFFPTQMSARLIACFTEDDDDRDLHEPVYRTFIFGSTVNDWWATQADADPSIDRAAVNRDFLDLQMNTITTLIGAHFSHLGFAV